MKHAFAIKGYNTIILVILLMQCKQKCFMFIYSMQSFPKYGLIPFKCLLFHEEHFLTCQQLQCVSQIILS